MAEEDFTSFGLARLRTFERRVCALRPATERLGFRRRDLFMATGFSVVNLLVGDLRERSLVRGLRLLLLRLLALRVCVPDERAFVCGMHFFEAARRFVQPRTIPVARNRMTA